MRNTHLIVSFILLLSFVGASAQTYMNTYTPSRNHQLVAGSRAQVEQQNVYTIDNPSFSTRTMPEMSPTMFGVSTPMASVGAPDAPQLSTTTSRMGNIRRGIGGGSEDDEGEQGGDNGKPENQNDPYATPLGDAAIPLALCALAYLIVRVGRKRSRV